MKTLERHLILGFDAGCMTCSDLAHSIEEAAGGRLEVRSLHDPQVEHWRKQALGENAPWAPTLIEVRGGQVKAWTGLRMGLVLSRKLGPVTTWRVMQVLSEVRGPKSAAERINRRQFIKGVGGATVAMSVLSGTNLFSASAEAEEHWVSELSFASSKELSHRQAISAWNQLSREKYLQHLLNVQAVRENPSASRLSEKLGSSAEGKHTPYLSTGTVQGVRHELVGGGSLLALSYLLGDALIVSYQLSRKGKRYKQSSKVIVRVSEEYAWILASAEDDNIAQAPIVGAEPNVSTQSSRCRNSRCPSCYRCECVSLSLRCAFNCCAPCGLSCSNPWTCLGCVGVYCPVCLSVNKCCTKRGCAYVCVGP